jgi:hypothetical protein
MKQCATLEADHVVGEYRELAMSAGADKFALGRLSREFGEFGEFVP